uniref:Uncharacterized protein n=1 Tax=Oryza sativa subsp. japonica TaxID=39947 RepID=Q6ETG1_ORYSJ|nr:hypothetical protein [Oryza sativa Japonica Group]
MNRFKRGIVEEASRTEIGRRGDVGREQRSDELKEYVVALAKPSSTQPLAKYQ